MTDERSLERAEELEGFHMSYAAQKIRALVPTGPGSAFCEECDNEMPPVRQQAGYIRCVGCVEVEETRNRQLRGLGVRP